MMNYNDLRRAPLFYKIPIIAALRRMAGRTRTASSRSILKVAERWLLANESQVGLDQMARLQVLEGAAGLRAWTWSRNPSKGLPAALAHFADQRGTINPAWFSKGNTGLVQKMVNAAESILRDKVTEKTSEELASDVIMGLKAEGVYETPSLVALGAENRAKILSGKENPADFGGGLGSKQIRQRAIDQVRAYQRDHSHRGPQVRDDEETGQIEDLSSRDKPEFEEFLLDAMMESDNRGRALQRIFQNSAKGDVEQQIVDLLLNEIVRNPAASKDPAAIYKELAVRLGLTSPTTVAARMRRSILPRFHANLEKTLLYNKLLQAYHVRYAY